MNATTNLDGVLWSEVDDQVLAMEAALTRPPRPLALVTDRRPGAYLLVYAGPLPVYRQLRRPGGRRDRAPMVIGGGAPIYAGSAADLREHAGRRRLKLSRCSDIRPDDIMMVPLPTSTTAGALYAESGLIAAFEPVWNASWLSGFGSKARGAVRSGGPPLLWAQLHPLCGQASTLTSADLCAARDTVREYVARNTPAALTIRIDPTRRSQRGLGPVVSGLRLVTTQPPEETPN